MQKRCFFVFLLNITIINIGFFFFSQINDANSNFDHKMLSSKDIIHRIKANDESIIAFLYKSYRNEFIKWSLRRFAIQEDDVKDVFQDIVISFYRNVSEGKLNSINCSVKTYLFSCGRNHLLNLSKKNQKFINLSGFEFTNDEIINIEKMEKTHYDKNLIENAIKELPEDHQQVLKMYYYDNFSLDLIAKKLGYKNSNVIKTIKSNSLKKMMIAIDKISKEIKILML